MHSVISKRMAQQPDYKIYNDLCCQRCYTPFQTIPSLGDYNSEHHDEELDFDELWAFFWAVTFQKCLGLVFAQPNTFSCPVEIWFSYSYNNTRIHQDFWMQQIVLDSLHPLRPWNMFQCFMVLLYLQSPRICLTNSFPIYGLFTLCQVVVWETEKFAIYFLRQNDSFESVWLIFALYLGVSS